MRVGAALGLVLALSGSVLAQDASTGFPPSAPVEIVREHTDIDVNADGSFAEADETALRVLDSRAQRAFQQTTLSYTEGLQSLAVVSAYTLKADGEKIPVADGRILRGSGATSAPGFEDVKTLTIVYPQLEVGDQVVLVTLRKQLVPLFPGEFALRHDFSPALKADDVQVTLTAPANELPLRTEAVGLEGGAREEYAGKFRWVWRFRNDAPTVFAPGSVIATDDQPHLVVSSFPSYAVVGRDYAQHFAGKAEANSDIRALADRLTAGMTDRRAEAKALYDWVSKNISYVDIILGAGGFTPHAAAEVLANRYGDCKDHVMLLEALLAARGIASEPALIAANGPFAISPIPSPFYFNHLITWVPEFRLFLDSTARYAPFGVLPIQDADRPVVLVPGGEVSATPSPSAEDMTARAEVTVKFAPDGAADGTSKVSMTGAAAVFQRAFLELLPPDREKEMFQVVLGPGSEATIDRGNVQDLADPFSYSLHYHVPDAANFSGPGAISAREAIGLFTAGWLVVGLLPPKRDSDYLCPSLSANQTSTFELPQNVAVTSVPAPVRIAGDGIRFEMHFDTKDAHTVIGTAMLRQDHPRLYCTADYYNSVRPELARIAASLRGQILYK